MKPKITMITCLSCGAKLETMTSDCLCSRPRIPSTDEWGRAEFLRARHKQMAAQKAADNATPKPLPVLYIGDDDVIVCDNCNAEILDETILLVRFGRRVNCRLCFDKWYRNKPLTYRRLRADGGLGEEEQP